LADVAAHEQGGEDEHMMVRDWPHRTEKLRSNPDFERLLRLQRGEAVLHVAALQGHDHVVDLALHE
jgi:hypothetical protein